MDDLRIPKIAVEIVCHTSRNDVIAGSMFLDMMASSGYSVAQLLQFFDSPLPFFPLRLNGGTSILMQKQSIVRADVPGLFREYESEVVSQLDTRRKAIIHFFNSNSLEGDFIIDMPSDHARTLDLLNAGHRFVPFLLEEMLTLINTRQIYRVEEM